MYLEFFNFNREPFRLTPDPAFLYLSPSHREALAGIIYGVDHRRGFVLVTGQVGVGKTTILRAYLEHLDPTIKAAYILNPDVTFGDLLKLLFRQFQLVPEDDKISALVDGLHRFFLEEFLQHRMVVIIVDEAQNMPVETLEGLRILSNIETATDKLVQVVFSGQPEFEQKLQDERLMALRQRIAVRVEIKPLSKEDSHEYMHHRLSLAAGKNGDLVFTKGALARIVKKASGIPRVLNILGENALVTAYGYQRRQVEFKTAKEVISDREKPKLNSLKGLAVAVLSLMLLSVALFLLYAKRELFYARPDVLSQSVKQEAKEGSDAHDVKPEGSLAGAPTGWTGGPAGGTFGVTRDAERAKGEVEPAERQGSLNSKGWDNQQAALPFNKVVKKGEWLYKLVGEVYGQSDARLVKFVIKNNPRIRNSDYIMAGDTIHFPAIPRTWGAGVK